MCFRLRDRWNRITEEVVLIVAVITGIFTLTSIIAIKAIKVCKSSKNLLFMRVREFSAFSIKRVGNTTISGWPRDTSVLLRLYDPSPACGGSSFCYPLSCWHRPPREITLAVEHPKALPAKGGCRAPRGGRVLPRGFNETNTQISLKRFNRTPPSALRLPPFLAGDGTPLPFGHLPHGGDHLSRGGFTTNHQPPTTNRQLPTTNS